MERWFEQVGESFGQISEHLSDALFGDDDFEGYDDETTEESIAMIELESNSLLEQPDSVRRGNGNVGETATALRNNINALQKRGEDLNRLESTMDRASVRARTVRENAHAIRVEAEQRNTASSCCTII